LRAFLSPVMTQSQIHEVLPKAGLVYSEKSSLSEILSYFFSIFFIC